MFPNQLESFINQSSWVFAKTYAQTWPHEYIVKKDVCERLFIELVRYIRKNGYSGKFYQKDITYFDNSSIVYWTMGALAEETTIINRCKKENSYEYRLKHNQLPQELK